METRGPMEPPVESTTPIDEELSISTEPPSSKEPFDAKRFAAQARAEATPELRRWAETDLRARRIAASETPNLPKEEYRAERSAIQTRLKLETFFYGVHGLAKRMAEKGKSIEHIMVFMEMHDAELSEPEKGRLRSRTVTLMHERFPTTAPKESPQSDDRAA